MTKQKVIAALVCGTVMGIAAAAEQAPQVNEARGLVKEFSAA